MVRNSPFKIARISIADFLKPLREKTYHEAEVIAAHKAVDEAFRKYYCVLRSKMAELEPDQIARIE